MKARMKNLENMVDMNLKGDFAQQQCSKIKIEYVYKRISDAPLVSIYPFRLGITSFLLLIQKILD